MIRVFHNFLYKKSLKFQTTAAIIATILLPVMIIGFASAINVSKSSTSLAIGTVTQICENIASEFDSLYSEANMALMRTSVSDDVKNYFAGSGTEYELYQFYIGLQNNDSLSRLFEAFPIIECISFVKPDGSGYTYSTSSASAAVDYNSGISSVVNQIHSAYPVPNEAPGTYMLVTSFPTKNNSALNYISLARCVLQNGKPIGYAIINFDASMLKNLWHSVNTADIEIQILCRDGTILYHDNSALINTVFDLIPHYDFSNHSGGNLVAKTNNTKQFIVYSVEKNSGCLVMTGIPMSILRAPANNVVLIIVITCILMIFFTFTMSFLLMKSILQPALILRDYVSNFGKGKFEIINVEFPQNEIGELADAYNSMAQKITDMIEQVYNAEIEKGKHALAVNQAELHAMQMQITPHFIYNTLSTINAHAILINNSEIQDIVNSLSSLIRYSLGQVWKPTTLEEEVAQLRCYLNIQSYRRSIMPKTVIEIDGYEKCAIIRLLLQPMVENIFTHAFPEGIDEGSTIDIRAFSKDNTLYVRVSDNGCGINSDKLRWLEHHIEEYDDGEHSFGGIGIKNIHKRIQLTYGCEYGLTITNNSCGGAEITASMPLQRQTVSTGI